MASNTSRPPSAEKRRVDADHGVAVTTTDAPRVAHRLAGVALSRGDRVDAPPPPLLVGAALGGAALALGGELLELVLLVAQALELLLELVHLVQQGPLAPALTLVGRVDLVDRSGAEVGQWVARVARRRTAAQVLT